MPRVWTQEQRDRLSAKMRAKKSEIAVPTAEEVKQYEQQAKDTTPDLVSAFTAAIKATKEEEGGRDLQLVKAIQDTGRKENPVSPMYSDFNPDGDNVEGMGRPNLKCKTVTQCGFPVLEAASTKEELVHLNLLIDMIHKAKRENRGIPDFMVSKADGSQARVRLECRFNEVSGTLESLGINYPVKTIDMRSGLYSFLLMLKEMLGLDMPKVDTPALLARLRTLESENKLLRMG